MAKNKVEISGINTRDLKTLSNEEMTILFKEYKEGSKEAKNRLAEGNLKLVLSILKKYHNRVDNMDDLFQIGCVGIIKAIDNFDLSYNVNFSTYAVFMIDGEVKRYIRDNNGIRISRSIKEMAYNVISYKEEYFNNYSYYPSNDEICEHLNITPYELSLAVGSLSEPTSIFEPIFNDGGEAILLLDQIEDARIPKNLDDLIALRKSLTMLKDKEREILIKRYMVGISQSEIANSLNISQAQVSRLESSAINTLRKLIR